MGKEQSKLSATSVSVAGGASKALEHAISTKELAEVQKTILLEYPFLENVYESMLLTDNRLPDCPIVFANDQVRLSLLLFPSFSPPGPLRALLLFPSVLCRIANVLSADKRRLAPPLSLGLCSLRG